MGQQERPGRAQPTYSTNPPGGEERNYCRPQQVFHTISLPELEGQDRRFLNPTSMAKWNLVVVVVVVMSGLNSGP
jgi:hypothetical protein